MRATLIVIAQWVVLGYFVGLNVGYLALMLISLRAMTGAMAARVGADLPRVPSGLEPPVSIIVPAHNEEATIDATVDALLQLTYADYEVIVVNDGSTDGTLEVLRQRFDLAPFPEAFRVRLPTRPVRGVYISRRAPSLRVLDKENGGKSDALNAGINAARYPLFCVVDADSILQRESLLQVVVPFMEDARTVASGGTVRIANGCTVHGGFLLRAGLPRSILARFQVVEYLRAFLFGRLGWSPLNAVLVISGTFGVFHKESVLLAGGYRTDTIGEDMELVVRLHRTLREARRPYRIRFVPDPICWSEVPEDLRSLGRQRIRWQRGLLESLAANRRLMLNRRGGTAGWLAFPWALVFEALGPGIEVLGYLLLTLFFVLGVISLEAFVVFLAVAVGLGTLLSVGAILLEEISFRVYPHWRHLLAMLVAAVAENFGYRQINSFWRLVGIVRWARGSRGGWGTMRRSGAWKEEAGV